ncbi:MAG: hypothetical protein OEZ39_09145 [Gammaproteobacteria bacterium]|nr:hypothetical protein [Gammaproteobacteria bacterium]MDH5652009.1 hypothetical protein [Gammaproteobacteria bacterium]
MTTDMQEDTITLYRPTGPNELKLVEASGYTAWPPRLPEQPVFYPVTNEQYAREIAEKWNVKQSSVGFVTRFEVRKSFMDKYSVQQVGAAHHTEWWIPAEELPELNANIVGTIAVIGKYEQDQQ